MKQAFQRLGIAHLLAVSGYHVGLVSSLFLLLLTTQHRWLKRLSLRAILLAESSWTWCSTRPYSGITAWMWVPLSMHWVIQACRGAVRRRVVWRSMV